MNKFADEIAKILRRVEWVGRRSSRIFEDWLTAVELTLESLPYHAERGEIGEDSPEAQEAWKKLKETYRDDDCWEAVYNAFAQGFGQLILSAEDGYQDTIGDVYMMYGHPNTHAGQFFTPMNVCRMMAGMQIVDGERVVMDRIKEAVLGGDDLEHIFAQSVLMCAPLAKDARRYFLEELLPAALRCGVSPITVCDPTVGSGAMLLAVAERFPRWAIESGLVQFYGQDIDAMCVRMARINCMLYGLNGFYAKVAGVSGIAERIVQGDSLKDTAFRVPKNADLGEVSLDIVSGKQLTLF